MDETVINEANVCPLTSGEAVRERRVIIRTHFVGADGFAILIIGLLVSILQVVTQIQEMTLTLISKLIIIVVILLMLGS